MKKTLRNIEMAGMLAGLEPILSRRDRLGYVAARNYRKLSDALTEYTAFRQDLIKKYGETDRDENGAELGTISLKCDSPKFKAFMEELEPLGNIAHEVDLMTAPYTYALDKLSGEELLRVDWMFED